LELNQNTNIIGAQSKHKDYRSSIKTQILLELNQNIKIIGAQAKLEDYQSSAVKIRY